MSSTQSRYFRPGQYLFREGDPSNCIYIVQKGTIAIQKRKAGGQVEIARVYAHEVLGEMSFFDRLPRSASAIALTEVDVTEITFESLETVYQNIPDYLKA